jgi:hypothetical protein
MLGILRLAHGLGRISWYLLSVLKGELIKKKKKKPYFQPKTSSLVIFRPP